MREQGVLTAAGQNIKRLAASVLFALLFANPCIRLNLPGLTTVSFQIPCMSASLASFHIAYTYTGF